MDIETAFRKLRSDMQRHIASFSGDETAARDAVSQAFTSAWAHRTMLEGMPEPAMKAWLYASARNAVVDMKRRESRFTAMPDYDLPDGCPWDITDRLTVEELMRSLPPDLSIPIHMKYYQGMNSTEIGRIMGIPAATIRTRLRKALTILRQRLKGESSV